MMMRPLFGYCALLSAIVCAVPSVSLAQEELSSDQLRRMYDDALAQLKTAQDRRNELAKENQKLVARISQLEKEVESAKAEVNDMADKTFQSRSLAAMLQDFLQSNPYCRMKWQEFREKNVLTRPDSRLWLDPDWPLPSMR